VRLLPIPISHQIGRVEMPVLETALLVKGAAALIKAGPVIWAKIAGYAAAHGVAATVSAVAGLAIVVGGIKWTQEKIE